MTFTRVRTPTEELEAKICDFAIHMITVKDPTSFQICLGKLLENAEALRLLRSRDS